MVPPCLGGRSSSGSAPLSAALRARRAALLDRVGTLELVASLSPTRPSPAAAVRERGASLRREAEERSGLAAPPTAAAVKLEEEEREQED